MHAIQSCTFICVHAPERPHHQCHTLQHLLCITAQVDSVAKTARFLSTNKTFYWSTFHHQNASLHYHLLTKQFRKTCNIIWLRI